MLSEKSPMLAALVAALSLAPDLLAAPAPAGKEPLAFELSVQKGSHGVGDRVAFTLTVRNNSGKPLKLDVKPARRLNNGYNALANGELLRRVVIADGKKRACKPDLTSFAGILPGVMVRGVELSLKPGEVHKVAFGAKVVRDREGKVCLLFDDPESPGLKRFGARLCRSAWGFPLTGDKLTLRLVYDRGGVNASSNDLRVRFGGKK
jgi:hypothetical protein